MKRSRGLKLSCLICQSKYFYLFIYVFKWYSALFFYREVAPGSGDNKTNEGKIFYTFDEVDDWDEEDPDDDLNM